MEYLRKVADIYNAQNNAKNNHKCAEGSGRLPTIVV